MRKKLLVLSLLLVTSCGLFSENYRTVEYTSKNGDKIKLTVFDQKEVFGKEKSLSVYANEHSFKGKQCEDAELKNLGNELWKEMVKRNYVSEVKSGTVFVLRTQGEVKPEYCRYVYLKNENGEWTE